MMDHTSNSPGGKCNNESCSIIYLILPTTLGGGVDYHSHFTNEEIKAKEVK